MKKIIFNLVLLFYVQFVFGQILVDNEPYGMLSFADDHQIAEENKNPGFEVEMSEYFVVLVPSSTTIGQCRYIAYRSTCNPKFDTTFFDRALYIMEYKYDVSEIDALRLWGSIIKTSQDDYLSQKYYNYLINQSDNYYNLGIKQIKKTKKYDIIAIGNIKLKIIKKNYGFWKNRVKVKDGQYYIRMI